MAKIRVSFTLDNGIRWMYGCWDKESFGAALALFHWLAGAQREFAGRANDMGYSERYALPR